MRITVLTLCDAGSVRENLVSMLGAGLTLVQPQDYPAPLQPSLALQLTAHADEVGAHAVELTIGGTDDERAPRLMEATLGLNVEEPSQGGGSFQSFSIVLDLSEVLVPVPGDYVIRARLDSADPVEYGFTAAEPARAAHP
ncbi:DUF6941 family protein [Leifsonia sp. SIMBA_070]|uniref:DUF6941 family protein n=1 Tax=Leifsonia sp. SIMBA_070 TaxID=3085810 RepID=UPI003979468D